MELPIHVCIKSKSTYAPNGSINHLTGDRMSNVLVEGVSGKLAKSPKQSKANINETIARRVTIILPISCGFTCNL